MSESAAEGNGPGTDPADPTGAMLAAGADGNGGTPDPDDEEAQRLLGQMADQNPEELQRQSEHWKAEARKWEDRAKTNNKAAAKLKEIEDANKSELELAQQALAEANTERDKAVGQHNRVMAAAAFDLPVDLVDDLGSGTAEEISARAERFSTIIQNRAQQIAEEMMTRNGYPVSAGGSRPMESLRPGSAPAGGGTPTTTDDWFRTMLMGGGE